MLKTHHSERKMFRRELCWARLAIEFSIITTNTNLHIKLFGKCIRFEFILGKNE